MGGCQKGGDWGEEINRLRRLTGSNIEIKNKA